MLKYSLISDSKLQCVLYRYPLNLTRVKNSTKSLGVQRDVISTLTSQSVNY